MLTLETSLNNITPWYIGSALVRPKRSEEGACELVEEAWSTSTIVNVKDVKYEVTDRSKSPAIREALARLDRFASLKENWDGEGAAPVHSIAIEEAQFIIDEMVAYGLEPDLVVPGKSGEVVIEYVGAGQRLAQVISEPDRSKFLITYSNDGVSPKTVFRPDDLLAFHKAVPRKAGRSWFRRLLP